MTNLLADIKSHFSIGESLLEVDEIPQLAADAGYDAAALCDTMTISGMPDFTRKCRDLGIKPIIGVRLRIVDTLDKVEKQKASFIKLFILSEEGFRIITRLLSVANQEDHFHYKPRLIWDDVLSALEHAKDHIAYASNSLYSAIRNKEHPDMLEKIGALLGRSLTFCEVTAAHSAVWDRQAAEAYAAAEKGFPILLSSPVIYPRDGMLNVVGLMNSISSNLKINRGDDYKPFVDTYTPREKGELVRAAAEQFKRLRRMGHNFDPMLLKGFAVGWKRLCDAVTWQWDKMDVCLPQMAADENAELTRLCKEGLKQRLASDVFGDRPHRDQLKAYADRLKYELGVLTDMGFAGYFLLTREIVMWSKENGIRVGPGRGSVGGSLVAYVLGITDVDPIRFELIFERFINPERLDLPDADLDFMSTRRHEVIKHIEQTYGEDRVAGISNYSTMGSKSVLQDITRIFDMEMIDRTVSKQVPEERATGIPLERAAEESAAVGAFAARHPEKWALALQIENKNRSLGRHAAGIVIAGEELTRRAVVERRSGEPTVNWDKRVVEDMGLVKMDILGLSTLDLIEVALRKVKARHGRTIDMNTIPLNDEDVMDAFGRGRTVGVFQFESGGMRKLLKNLRAGGPLTFDDITAATALYRPGPMDSGLLDDFVAIKQGMMTEHYEHPSMQASLEETYSVIVYQEQIMRVAQDLCGFTMAQADHLRKAMGKKDAEKMGKLRPQFVGGAVAAGMDEDKAEELWDKAEKFAGYAFNKSHAVEYSLISYQAMWLKVNYPLEFFAAAMTILSDDKRPGLLKDAAQAGITVLPPDINTSTNEFEILDDETIVAALSVVKNVSAKASVEIMTKRAEGGRFTSIEDIQKRCVKRLVNKRVIENLDKVGAFARMEKQIPADDDRRRPDQLELCPTIMSGGAIVTRDLHHCKVTKAAIRDELQAVRDEMGEEAILVLPRMGRNPKFMVITDGPGWSEEQGGRFTEGKSFGYIAEALMETGLEIADGYWTGLSKLPKPAGQKLYPMEQLKAFEPLLRKEIEITNPQVIVVLGTNVMRMLLPKMKGGIIDHATKVVYMPASAEGGDDRNIVLGFNPGMIAFDDAKREVLIETFRKVSEMVL